MSWRTAMSRVNIKTEGPLHLDVAHAEPTPGSANADATFVITTNKSAGWPIKPKVCGFETRCCPHWGKPLFSNERETRKPRMQSPRNFLSERAGLRIRPSIYSVEQKRLRAFKAPQVCAAPKTVVCRLAPAPQMPE